MMSRLRRPLRYWQIFFLILITRPRRILEIGIWTGDRALTMLRVAKWRSSATDIHYYGCDLFEQMTSAKFSDEKSKWPLPQDEVMARLKPTQAHIHILAGDTMNTLPKLVREEAPMDFIFIDGGHSLETIASDWLWVSRLMHKGTVVVFDDYWIGRTDAGCKVTVDNIDRTKYHVSLLPIVDSFSATAFGPLRIKLAKVTRASS